MVFNILPLEHDIDSYVKQFYIISFNSAASFLTESISNLPTEDMHPLTD